MTVAAIDQFARDAARDAAHEAALSAQAIRQHMVACERNHAEDRARFDRLESGLGRIHGRIDVLVRGMLFAALGLMGSALLSVLGWLASNSS